MGVYQKVEVTIRMPMPKSAEDLVARLDELTEARKAIDEEIRDLTGTSFFRSMSSTENNCIRCGNKWKPRVTTIRSKVCPRCGAQNWDKPRQYRRVKVAHDGQDLAQATPIIPSVPVFPPPTPVTAYVPSFTPDTIIGMTPPPIAYGLSTSPPRPDPIASPLRDQISYRISQREEPQPEGYVGVRPKEEVRPEPDSEVRPQVAPAAPEEVAVDGGVGAPDLNQEQDRLDELERIALEAINGSKSGPTSGT